MPVCEKAITKSIKDAKHKPGECREAECNEIQFSPSFIYPSEQVEEYERNVEDEEEIVGQYVESRIFHWVKDNTSNKLYCPQRRVKPIGICLLL